MGADGERSRSGGDGAAESDASGDSPGDVSGDASESADAGGSADPRVVRSLAVTTDDVVTALEANERRGTDAVLRVTPPFAGRMRARLHVEGGEGEYDGEVTPLHVGPEAFLAEDLPYPTVDRTGDELRASEEAYTRERHRARHAEAVERWRASVRDSLADAVTISLDGEPHTVEVRYLG
ncbi:hypothetical protein [Halopelagius fulvigenes]|uniref:DUF8009 domain-containing protein n=1 Tax=Halopelagius fulvigenes TaxID=1198324 RepID=A0ABD5TXR8_9EURY